jgi:hypothetical protein
MFENVTIGRQTGTTVSLAYINGIVNRDVLNNVRDRVSQIDTDIILESGQIEQYIEENTFSPISGIGLTQKPDVVAHRISEGCVAILCDGTPHVLTAPELMISNIFTIEDYYNRAVYASIIRILRLIGLFITVLLPGLAIAILTYHPEMMPSVFLTNVIDASMQTPMPMAAEVFLLILMFELLGKPAQGCQGDRFRYYDCRFADHRRRPRYRPGSSARRWSSLWPLPPLPVSSCQTLLNLSSCTGRCLAAWKPDGPGRHRDGHFFDADADYFYELLWHSDPFFFLKGGDEGRLDTLPAQKNDVQAHIHSQRKQKEKITDG